MNLITEPDMFEKVRERILLILLTERDDQKQQAAAQSLDPALWDFKLYEERSMPWGAYLEQGADLTPIVNVWFDADSFDESATTRAETQKCNATYNIDIYGAAKNELTVQGQEPADRSAALEAQRVARLVRSILMASQYTYLNYPDRDAWDRQLSSRQAFQPDINDVSAVKISAMRIRFRVSFNETGPQYQPVPLDQIGVTVLRKETGEVYLNALYD